MSSVSFAARGMLFVVGVLALAAVAASAEPLDPEDVPEPLRPWIDWVLRGHESARCPGLVGSGARHCVWPSRLELELGPSAARFSQHLLAAIAAEVPLPGAAGSPTTWPEAVRVDGRAVPILERRGRPFVFLPMGRHHITGTIPWRGMPPSLQIPPGTGLVSATHNGRPVTLRRESAGRLWLHDDAAAARAEARETLEVEVHRRVEDGIPLLLETRIGLRVSGSAREVLLGVALPERFVPMHLEGELPARLEPDGRLRVQVRPGTFALRLFARDTARTDVLRAPLQPEGGIWDATEEWVFEARPQLRAVDLEDGVAIDPTQTQLPSEWRALPAFRFDGTDGLRLVERQRGRSETADRLRIDRTFHLDFSGNGATVSDAIAGELVSSTRLEMSPGTSLGRVAVAGVDQPVTRLEGAVGAGVELALGPVQLNADSRIEAGASSLSAVGWAHDFDSAAATLYLPPGWRLFHATGVDDADLTWIARWTLLDVFLVMIAGVAALRLFGRRVGLLAGIALVLSYTEPGAPRVAWLVLLGLEALRRVAPEGRLLRWIGAARGGTLGLLVIVTVPFAIQQVRAGLFPALERPVAAAPTFLGISPALIQGGVNEIVVTAGKREQSIADVARGLAGELELAEEDADARLPVSRELGTPRAARGRGLVSHKRASLYDPDPDTTVATGPGLPEWTWTEVSLSWSGPVDAEQRLGLWLVPPWANAFLALLRIAAVVALGGVLFGMAPTPLRRWLRIEDGSSAGTLLALCLLAFPLAMPSGARAEVPPQATLDELRSRLLEPAPCHPNCAQIARMGLGVRGDRAEIVLEVETGARTAVPLPGSGANGLAVETVTLDGTDAADLLRTADGAVWVLVPEGIHQVRILARLPNRATVEIPLPLAPRRSRLRGRTEGWTLAGLRPDGGTAPALQLIRESGRTESDELEPTDIPPFVRVERTLELGLRWAVRTTVHRVAPRGGALVVEVPLLPGESVTTPGLEVAEGHVRVALGPRASGVSWASILEPSERLVLVAPEEVAWTEIWRIDPSPIWHVSSEGVPPVASSAGRRLREWQPWPGETLTLSVDRPEGTGGRTWTVDRAGLRFTPGLRSTDVQLDLTIRSSQADRHSIALPKGSDLTRIQIEGRDQPLRQEDSVVSFPIQPGSQTVTIGWREARSIALVSRAPAIDLGARGVNAHIEANVPDGRWLLGVGGPRLGPVLLFWPILGLWMVLAWGLARVEGIPLRARHWIGLAIGFTQASMWAAGVFVTWLLALAWRRRHAEAQAHWAAWAFDGLQLGLVALTALALASLLATIETGLLGSPEMDVLGNGSSGHHLRWYADRIDGALPVPWMLSLPLWVYRLAMLAWSLWIAQAPIGWLRWSWDCFGTGGLWRPLRRRRAAEEIP